MQELNGYIKIYRKLLQWGWYKDGCVKDVFIHLLLSASFRSGYYMGQKINVGQAIIGIKKLSSDLGFSVQQVRTALKKLESTGEITVASTNKFSIVTIANWTDYQSGIDGSNKRNEKNSEDCVDFVKSKNWKEQKRKKSTNKITNKISLENVANKEIEESDICKITSNLTNEQQTNNKRTTNEQQHLKNVKNVKKVKNVCVNETHTHTFFYGELKNVELTIDQHEQLCLRFDKASDLIDKVSLWLPEHLGINDHYAMCLKFARNDNWPKKRISKPEEIVKADEDPMSAEEMATALFEMKKKLGGTFNAD